jgi:alpha-galactosidase
MKNQPVLILALFSLPGTLPAAERPRPVKVFILAGQSNMQGKAKLSLLDYQARQPATRGFFKHFRQGDKWIERDDVWIKYREEKGKLTAGYGSPKCVGPELEFGFVVGEHYMEQVLLIKTAWGGKSLYKDFRPPSARLPPASVLDRMLAEQKKGKPATTIEDLKGQFGASYRAMVDEVRSTQADLKRHFPAYAGQGHELAGFIWFHGWNDMINADYTAAYTDNLAHLIRDVRKDLKAPGLPAVVGLMGVGGTNPSRDVKRFQAAQARIMDIHQFKGNVAVVKTDLFWDTEADAVFKKGWRKHLEEWNKVGSDYPYHYLGSGRTYCRIGRALALAVVELRGGK